MYTYYKYILRFHNLPFVLSISTYINNINVPHFRLILINILMTTTRLLSPTTISSYGEHDID